LPALSLPFPLLLLFLLLISATEVAQLLVVDQRSSLLFLFSMPKDFEQVMTPTAHPKPSRASLRSYGHR